MGLLSEAADATVGVPSPRRRAQFESVQRSSRKGWKSFDAELPVALDERSEVKIILGYLLKSVRSK